MEDTLKWVSHPAKTNPKGIFIAVASILLAGVLVGLIAGSNASELKFSTGWGIFASGILTLSLRGFFWPTRYRLDENGISIRGLFNRRDKTWTQCKSIRLDANGVLVSPFAFETRLENYRGVYLRFEGNKKEVMDYLEAHIKKSDSQGELVS